VAGLRYLYTATNPNTESPAAGSILTSSTTSGGGYGPPFLLYGSNYTAFASAALTNNPATLATLFPGLVVTSSSYYFTNIAIPNIIYVTNAVVGAPAGTMQVVIATNGFTNVQLPIYSYTFANLVITNGYLTNYYHTNTSAQLVTFSVMPKNGAPAGTLQTNTTFQSITLTNVPSGDYYIDTNYTCGPTIILSTLATNVTATTNLIFAVTNSAGYFTSQSLVIYSTTHVFVAESPVCAVTTPGNTNNATGLYRGIEKIQFIYAPYDSLLGQTWQPVTNNYSMIIISGSQATTNKFQRVVTTPDIVFSAKDMAGGNGALPTAGFSDRNIEFEVNNILPNLAGPGTIDRSTTIAYNKVGDIYLNTWATVMTNQFLIGPSEFTQGPNLLAWASFDSSTNDPVVYPNGTSIQNLENQILVQLSISPSTTNSTLLNGTYRTNYTATTFTASGGAFTPPFTWSATGLPPGLTVTTTNSAALLSGTPTQSGTFDFTLTLTDVISRSVQWNLAITIQ
jgi:hypothetical protein